MHSEVNVYACKVKRKGRVYIVKDCGNNQIDVGLHLVFMRAIVVSFCISK